MNLFGLSFLFFILKWSAGKWFSYQIRVTDKSRFQKVITVERTQAKVEKCKLDINYLVRCQECNLYPSFTKAKHLKDMSKKLRNTYQRRLLLDEISNKHEQFKSLTKQLTSETDDTLLIIKKKDITYVLNQLNNFQGSLHD